MIKEFVTYKVYINKVNHEDLYRLLENMPKAIRGIYIREAIAHYARTNGRLGETPQASGTEGISLQGTFNEDFGGPV
jgi:hypothetical protein